MAIVSPSRGLLLDTIDRLVRDNAPAEVAIEMTHGGLIDDTAVDNILARLIDGKKPIGRAFPPPPLVTPPDDR